MAEVQVRELEGLVVTPSGHDPVTLQGKLQGDWLVQEWRVEIGDPQN